MHDADLHLFVHERQIALRQHLHRRINPMRRDAPGPVLPANGADEGTAIGYATAARLPEDHEWRLWYMCHLDGRVRLATSADGVTWQRRGPAVVGDRATADNLAVVPVGPQADPWFAGARLAGYLYGRGKGEEAGALRGLHLVRSPDGRQLEVRELGILPGVGDRSSLTYDDVEKSQVEGVDELRHRVRWGDRGVVDPVGEGRCHLRFTLKQASFFGYRWSRAVG
ncbi:MAG: hypothetical protein AB1505_13070 [Candidatus Latescibacterota bacterium]